jgi:S-adenosylmethionine-dependent methyltransferase
MRIELTEAQQEALSALLHDRVFSGANRQDLDAEFNVHLNHRLTEARNNLVPWLAQFIQLDTARILEVGAGTGSSVIAFAEVCQHIDAIDILDTHLDVTRARVAMHKLGNVSIYCRNATSDLSEITDSPYSLIVFAASLEHMLYEERIAALRMAWQHLATGGVLCIYETPNRLWFFDGHTSQANFFNWLPDQLAIDYASRTPRPGFSSQALTGEKLYRWGRGVSFHEIEVAIGLQQTEMLESMHEYLTKMHPGYLERTEPSIARDYRALLAKAEPNIAAPFTEETLNFALMRR